MQRIIAVWFFWGVSSNTHIVLHVIKENNQAVVMPIGRVAFRPEFAPENSSSSTSRYDNVSEVGAITSGNLKSKYPCGGIVAELNDGTKLCM